LRIELQNTGKKFNNEWIFRNLTFTFEQNNAYAILGRNGSGKSTLLQVIAGSIHPTEGKVNYFSSSATITSQEIFRSLSIVAPYQELIEEFTLTEMLKFHFSFKQIIPGKTIRDAIEVTGLKNAENKPIRLFSSGMKQRVKLILAIFSTTPILLLDEPTNNLDQAGIDWYLDLIKGFSTDRVILVCSNLQQQETAFCSGKIFIEDYKKAK
jgi:ABC-type multidrug transport system ATPase subunit